MNFKIIKDVTGLVLACGPNTEQYEPSIPPGCTLTVEATQPLPAWPPIKAQELDKVRETRERTINRLTGIAARAARAGDTATATACDAATVALLGMTSTPSVLAAADLPALKLAIQTAYAGAVALLPVSARNAFNGANV